MNFRTYKNFLGMVRDFSRVILKLKRIEGGCPCDANLTHVGCLFALHQREIR